MDERAVADTDMLKSESCGLLLSIGGEKWVRYEENSVDASQLVWEPVFSIVILRSEMWIHFVY